MIGINGNEIFQKSSGIHTFGHKRNKEILEELKVELVDEKLGRYKSNWLRHAKIMLSFEQMNTDDLKDLRID
jgi:isopropylmalate/homocitrate/citramalate synthase